MRHRDQQPYGGDGACRHCLRDMFYAWLIPPEVAQIEIARDRSGMHLTVPLVAQIPRRSKRGLYTYRRKWSATSVRRRAFSLPRRL
jgi:hypothetical protein